MYCSECGVQANGKFCWNCGHRLRASAEAAEPDVEPDIASAELHWTELTDCAALLRIPEVRDRIARCASEAPRQLTGEELLACFDKLFSSVAGGVPLGTVAKLAQPLTEKLGIKTSKSRTERLPHPPGAVLVSLLCSLAQRGQPMRQAISEEQGCVVQATLPSDVCSLRGDLAVRVRVEGRMTVVEACVTIPGQAFDWGKSQRCLDQLFSDLGQTAARLSGPLAA